MCTLQHLDMDFGKQRNFSIKHLNFFAGKVSLRPLYDYSCAPFSFSCKNQSVFTWLSLETESRLRTELFAAGVLPTSLQDKGLGVSTCYCNELIVLTSSRLIKLSNSNTTFLRLILRPSNLLLWARSQVGFTKNIPESSF